MPERRSVFAVRAGASGDISLAKGEEQNAFVAWTHPRAPGTLFMRTQMRLYRIGR